MTMFAAMVGDEFGDRPGECDRCEEREYERWKPSGAFYEEWTCPRCGEQYARRRDSRRGSAPPAQAENEEKG